MINGTSTIFLGERMTKFDDKRAADYQPLEFYKKHAAKKDNGASTFDIDGKYYFAVFKDGKVVLISQTYVSEAGRNNGIKSVAKNQKLPTRYQFHKHASGKYYYYLLAGNGQDVASSLWYTSEARARESVGFVSGTQRAPASAPAVKKPVVKTAAVKKSTRHEDDYKPLAFFKKHVTSTVNGLHKFKGDDGEYYFAYNDNGKIALISEGYPTQAARDTGAVSVLKNVKIQSRYKYAKMKNGKHEARLLAGNGKEIARSPWFTSAAAAATGVAYLVGTRLQATPKPVAAVKPKAVAKAKVAPKVKPKAKAPSVKRAAPVVAAAAISAAIPAAIPASAAPTVKKARPPASATVVETGATPPAGGAGLGWVKWLLLALVLLAVLFGLTKCLGAGKNIAAETAAASSQMASDAKAAAKGSADAAAKAAATAAAKLQAEAEAAAQTVAKGVEAVQFESLNSEPDVAPALEDLPSLEKLDTPKPSEITALPSGALNACGPSDIAIFNVPTYGDPVNVTRLGTYPEFGNSHDLTPVQFYEKLRQRWSNNSMDRKYLNYLFRSMGYARGFRDADASLFSNAVMPAGITGLLGLGEQHHFEFVQLNTNDYDRQAFRIESRNGQAIHFMKTCGNYMYGCK